MSGKDADRRKQSNFQGTNFCGCAPQTGKVIIAGVSAGHGTGSTVGRHPVLLGFNDVSHPEQCALGGLGVSRQPQTGSTASLTALENAASVAEMVLTTESLVADLPEPPAAPAAGGDMGGMGGMY